MDKRPQTITDQIHYVSRDCAQVRVLADAIRSGAELPPIIITPRGCAITGMHRIEAHALADLGTTPTTRTLSPREYLTLWHACRRAGYESIQAAAREMDDLLVGMGLASLTDHSHCTCEPR